MPVSIIISLVLPKEVNDYILENELEINLDDLLCALVDLCAGNNNTKENINNYVNATYGVDNNVHLYLELISYIADIVTSTFLDLNLFQNNKVDYTVEQIVNSHIILMVRKDVFLKKLNDELR